MLPGIQKQSRKMLSEMETVGDAREICEIRWKDVKGAVSITFLFKEICLFSHTALPPASS